MLCTLCVHATSVCTCFRLVQCGDTKGRGAFRCTPLALSRFSKTAKRRGERKVDRSVCGPRCVNNTRSCRRCEEVLCVRKTETPSVQGHSFSRLWFRRHGASQRQRDHLPGTPSFPPERHEKGKPAHFGGVPRNLPNHFLARPVLRKPACDR